MAVQRLAVAKLAETKLMWEEKEHEFCGSGNRAHFAFRSLVNSEHYTKEKFEGKVTFSRDLFLTLRKEYTPYYEGERQTNPVKLGVQQRHLRSHGNFETTMIQAMADKTKKQPVQVGFGPSIFYVTNDQLLNISFSCSFNNN